MKKIFSKILVVTLALMFAFSFAACSKKGGGSSSDIGAIDKETGEYIGNYVSGDGVNTTYAESGPYTKGTHIFNISDTNEYVVKNGKSEYAVVLSDYATGNESSAVGEFLMFFEEATGVILPILSADGLEFDENLKYISFGENDFQQDSGIDVESAVAPINTNGYIIQTVGKSIIVLGGSDVGTLFGAYELLTQMFNYMCYSPECTYIDKGVTELKLKHYGIVDSPDIHQRIANYGMLYSDKIASYRMRFSLQTGEHGVYMTAAGISPFHNVFHYLPPETYQDDHPGWYSTGGATQLCYTARGDEEEYEALKEALTEAVKGLIDQNPTKRVLTITQMDDHEWCKCDYCSEFIADHAGANVSTAIRLVNEVADEIKEWLDTERNGRDVTIAIFAYHSTNDAPVVKNADGTYSPVSEDMILRDNVTALIAPLSVMFFNKPTEHPDNAAVNTQILSWQAIAKHISVWSYQTHFQNYFMPYNTYAACQQQYKRFIDIGAQWLFDQGQHNNGNSTHFSHLKIFLNSQWGWDVNRDYNELVDDFFEHYFGKKDGAMRQYYEELVAWMVHLEDELRVGRTTYDILNDGKYWPYRLVMQWEELCNKAYQEVESYKVSDPDKYYMFRDHINLESMFPRFCQLSYYSGMFTVNGLTEARRQFAQDCLSLNITRYAEGTGLEIQSFIGNWL